MSFLLFMFNWSCAFVTTPTTRKTCKILCCYFFGHSFELIFAQINNMKSRIIGIIHVRCSCFFSIFPKTKFWTSKIYFLFCEQKKFYFDAVADINSYSINDFIEILKIFFENTCTKTKISKISNHIWAYKNSALFI